jgi:hypothetical protein
MVSSENDNPSTSAQSSIICHYQNKYEKWYWSLIQKFEKRETLPDRFECHHPVPKEIWPERWMDRETITVVGVSFREHFILHLLLTKIGFSHSSLNRFLKNFCRGRQKGTKATNLKKFWDRYQFRGDKLPDKPWEHTYREDKTFLQTWVEADYFYWVWCNILPTPKGKGSGYSGNGYRNLAKSTGVPPSKSLRRMVNYFREGWVPDEDKEWIDFAAKI